MLAATTRPHGILLVDDDEMIRTVTTAMLSSQGYAVFQAHSCSDAVRVFEQNKPHIALLLTDVVMPHMSGRDLAKILCTAEPRLKVVFISGYSDMGAPPGITAHGFVQKPFRSETLLAAVRSAIGEA